MVAAAVGRAAAAIQTQAAAMQVTMALAVEEAVKVPLTAHREIMEHRD